MTTIKTSPIIGTGIAVILLTVAALPASVDAAPDDQRMAQLVGKETIPGGVEVRPDVPPPQRTIPAAPDAARRVAPPPPPAAAAPTPPAPPPPPAPAAKSPDGKKSDVKPVKPYKSETEIETDKREPNKPEKKMKSANPSTTRGLRLRMTDPPAVGASPRGSAPVNTPPIGGNETLPGGVERAPTPNPAPQ